MNRIVSDETPDVLILNAGARIPMKAIDEQSWEEFSGIWNNDVQAGLAGIQAALKTPMRRGWARSGHVEWRGHGDVRAARSARKPEAFWRLYRRQTDALVHGPQCEHRLSASTSSDFIFRCSYRTN